jgi:hypothetical protein
MKKLLDWVWTALVGRRKYAGAAVCKEMPE